MRSTRQFVLVCGLCMACLLVSCTTPRGRDEVPKVLWERGLGVGSEPVTIRWGTRRDDWASCEYSGTAAGIAFAAAGLPSVNTEWFFPDPTPVWQCFAGTKTRRFLEGTYAFDLSFLTLSAGERKHRLEFSYDLGNATVCVSDKAMEGGDWRFEPVAVERLLRLLAQTPPSAVGVPIAGQISCYYTGVKEPRAVTSYVTISGRGWGVLASELRPKSPSQWDKPLPVPNGFDWTTGVAVVTWFPPATGGGGYTYGRPRMVGRTLSCDVSRCGRLLRYPTTPNEGGNLAQRQTGGRD
jgi:hypothetical protein